MENSALVYSHSSSGFGRFSQLPKAGLVAVGSLGVIRSKCAPLWYTQTIGFPSNSHDVGAPEGATVTWRCIQLALYNRHHLPQKILLWVFIIGGFGIEEHTGGHRVLFHSDVIDVTGAQNYKVASIRQPQ